jgi:hypothetical protein
MNQLKPYLLWIVAGVLFLVLVILMAVFTPTVELEGAPKDAYEIKAILDQDAKKLKALAKRARTGDPVGVFDPQSETDIHKLTNDYLLTKEWLDVINPHVAKYGQQLGQIREDLLARSKVLNEPVAPTDDRLQWYTIYQKLTGELVAKLRDGSCLVMPMDARSTFHQPSPAAMPVGAPPGMGVPPGGGTPAAGSATGESLDPETSAKLRSLVGLFTREGDYPDTDQHPLLTTRFRIAERIASAILASEAETLPNPLVPSSGGVRAPAAISSWEWKQDSEPLDPPVGDYAKPWRLTLTLEGSESALTAALARIESLDRPILVVLGSTLSRIERTTAGARRLQGPRGEAIVAPATLELQVLVLDFSQMPELTPGAAPAAGSGQHQSGMNGPPGMPPGMPNMTGGPPPGMGPPANYQPSAPPSGGHNAENGEN